MKIIAILKSHNGRIAAYFLNNFAQDKLSTMSSLNENLTRGFPTTCRLHVPEGVYLSI